MNNIIIELISALSAVKELSELSYRVESEEFLMRQVLNILMNNQDMERCSFFLLNDDGYLVNLTGLSFHDLSAKHIIKSQPMQFKLGEGIIGITAETKTLQQCDNTQEDERFLVKFQEGANSSVVPLSILSVPVFVNNEVIGVLNLSHPEADHFTDLHIRSLEVFKNILGQLITSYRLFKKMEDQISVRTRELENSLTEVQKLKEHYQSISILDPLTGIYNRRYFYNCIESLLDKISEYQGSICFFMIDLDYFKQVNDEYGHIFGDHVLIKVTKVLRQAVRESDILARFGGEEFVILSHMSADNGLLFAERIREYIECIEWEEKLNFSQTISIGFFHLEISENQSNEKLNSNDFIHYADIALYQAKALGRNRVVKFTKQMLEK